MKSLRTLALVALTSAALGAGAAFALTAQEVRTQIETQFPQVEVLRVVDAETSEGRPAYLVTVMNRGGTYNGAFQVTRVLVDRETGSMTRIYAQGPSGVPVGEPLSGPGAATEGFGETLRSRSFTPIPGRQ